jgi:hypothetical protein
MNYAILKGKFVKIWKNKWKILEGVWYNHVVFFLNKKHWAIKLVLHRRAICQTCEHYDEEGKGDNVILKGLPACGLCGCNEKEKTACLSCHCSLKDFDKLPLWDKVVVKNDYLIESQIEKYL